ncbi:mpv17-like protein [Eurytemora carolleeae]|uniref:mpv17-like protein n=1 Tax=Eurytemora carolleeae TaxID=1294199 RepID=UPI000C7619B0|nr:mpv17-like protein [Eurytemora carolleeae]|eukprot:XP_023334090.1 mpv17-like protein [Eurytemora affinis]
MAGLVGRVKHIFGSRPLLANCVVYGTLYSGSEFIQQTLLRKVFPEQKSDYDFANIARYGVLGTFVFPNILFRWYKWLDKRFVGTSLSIIGQKMLLDQFVISPPILAIFYTGMSIMEGKPDIFTECREKLVPTFQSSCMFWMPAQAINFLILPNQFRVVYVATCSLLWVNILCILKRDTDQI